MKMRLVLCVFVMTAWGRALLCGQEDSLPEAQLPQELKTLLSLDLKSIEYDTILMVEDVIELYFDDPSTSINPDVKLTYGLATHQCISIGCLLDDSSCERFTAHFKRYSLSDIKFDSILTSDSSSLPVYGIFFRIQCATCDPKDVGMFYGFRSGMLLGVVYRQADDKLVKVRIRYK